MESPAVEQGEDVLRAVLTHALLVPRSALVDSSDAGLRRVLRRLPDGVRSPLTDVAGAAAQARLVAQLATPSRAARAAAAAALPAAELAARGAKLAALRDTCAEARKAGIAEHDEVQAALVALCAPDAVPPAAEDATARDETERWRALRAAALAAVRAAPGPVSNLIGYVSLVLETPIGALPADDEDTPAVRNCRARRLVAALEGRRVGDDGYDDGLAD
jgi:hypothetical protein